MGNEVLIERALRMADHTEDVRAETMRELVAELAAARAEIAKLKEEAAYIGELHQQEQFSMVELAAARAENNRLKALLAGKEPDHG